MAMVADEQRRRSHLDPAELKILQTIVLDLEELRQFQRVAKRPGVRAILSREISSLESKIVDSSSAIDSDEKAPKDDSGGASTELAETSLKRKRRGRGQPKSSMITRKQKLAAIEKPFLVCKNCCKNMEEEPHQQETTTSEQVLQEKANLSDVNEVSPMADLSTRHADISDKMSQNTSSVAVISASGSRNGPSQKRSWCHICQVPNPVESVCRRLNGTLFKCHETEHVKKSCYKVRDAISPSGTRNVTAGSSCESTQEEPDQQILTTKAFEQVSWKKTNSFDNTEAF